ESGNLYFNVGNAWFKAGDVGRAILDWERARRLVPGDPDLLANLGWARSVAGTGEEPPVLGRLAFPFAERFSPDRLLPPAGRPPRGGRAVVGAPPVPGRGGARAASRARRPRRRARGRGRAGAPRAVDRVSRRDRGPPALGRRRRAARGDRPLRAVAHRDRPLP